MNQGGEAIKRSFFKVPRGVPLRGWETPKLSLDQDSPTANPPKETGDKCFMTESEKKTGLTFLAVLFDNKNYLQKL